MGLGYGFKSWLCHFLVGQSGKCSRFPGLSYLTVKWVKDKTFLDGVVRLMKRKDLQAPCLQKSQLVSTVILIIGYCTF